MKKNIKALICFLFIIFLTTGCVGGNFLNLGNVMYCPNLSEDEVSVKSIVIDMVGSDVIWKYPKRGDYKSSIIFCSLDNKSSQALVTYQESGTEIKSHIMILNKNQGVWEKVDDFSNNAQEIDKILISDLDGNGINEVIIGWASSDKDRNFASSYVYNDGNVKEIEICKDYTDFSSYNFNLNNSADLLIIYTDTEEKSAWFETAKLMGEDVVKTPKTKFNSRIEKFESLCVGIIDDRRRGAFVDFRKMDNSVITEIIYWDSGSREFILYDNVYNFEEFIRRNSSITCRDINSDGRLEIPVVSGEELYSEAVVPRRILNIIKWSNFNIFLKRFEPVQRCVYSCSGEYRFIIPEEWNSNIEVSYIDSAETMVFSKKENSGDGHIPQDIFVIKRVGEGDFKENQDKEDSIILRREKGFLYIAEIYKYIEDMPISKEKIIKNFKLENN